MQDFDPLCKGIPQLSSEGYHNSAPVQKLKKKKKSEIIFLKNHRENN